MSETVRVKGVVETVVPDNHFTDVGEVVDAVTPTNISKAAMNAFRRAKRVSVAENARARQIVAALRAKREGVTEAIPEAITEAITEESHTTSTSGQASIFDFLVDKICDGGDGSWVRLDRSK